MSFAPPPFPMAQPPPKATIKLALEAPNAEKEGPFVRVPLSGAAIDKSSMDLLRERALDLWKMNNTPSKHQMAKAKVTFTYRDVENDLCYIFTEEDLRCALPLFPASLRVFARVEVPLKKNKNEEEKNNEAPAVAVTEPKAETAAAASNNNNNNAASTQTSSTRSVADVPAHKVVESLVGVLTTAAVALQNNVKASTATAKSDEDAETKPSEEEELPFIHGRHTCDGCLVTPIVGTRWHATNLPDYDLCSSCKDNYKGNDVVFEAAELDRDRPMQERWNRRFSKFQAKQEKKQAKKQAKQEKKQAKREQAASAPPAAPGAQPPVFPPPPPHGPPHGPPPYFGPSPPHHGPPHHHPHGPPFGPPHHHHGPPHCRGPRRGGRWNRLYSAPPAQPEQVDHALQEAIRRSKLDLENAKKEFEIAKEGLQAAKEDLITDLKAAKAGDAPAEVTPLVATAPEEPAVEEEPKKEEVKETAPAPVKAEEEFEIPPAAPVGAHPAPRSVEETDAKPAAVVPAVIEKEESKTTEESFSDDAQGKGDVAAALGETLDKFALAVDEITTELARGAEEEASKKSDAVVVDAPTATDESAKAGATIVQGEDDDEDEVKSEDGSQNSWDVVGGDGLASDEALARAAQVIGSALFESGTAEGSNNPSMLGSDHSVPTTLPSVASQNGAVQEAQMQRWSLQLQQLHELGFMNDALNVEIMERLQAANIGSGEMEEVTVERVVNELMKDW